MARPNDLSDNPFISKSLDDMRNVNSEPVTLTAPQHEAAAIASHTLSTLLMALDQGVLTADALVADTIADGVRYMSEAFVEALMGVEAVEANLALAGIKRLPVLEGSEAYALSAL